MKQKAFFIIIKGLSFGEKNEKKKQIQSLKRLIYVVLESNVAFFYFLEL